MGTCSKSICSNPVSAYPLNLGTLQQNHLQLLFCHLQPTFMGSAETGSLQMALLQVPIHQKRYETDRWSVLILNRHYLTIYYLTNTIW